jgi:hypothetical protein
MSAWIREHTQITTATPAQLWARWTDAAAWAEDDPGVEWARFDGEPALGSTGRVKNHGTPAQRFTFTAWEPEHRMDCTIRLPLAALTITHTMKQTSRGLAATHGIRLSGPLHGLYGMLIGKQLAAGLPEVVGLVLAGAVREERAR